MLLAQTPDWVRQQFAGVTFDPNRLDIEDTPIYDTVALAQGAPVSQNTVSFFTNVKASSGKTLADTNLQRDSELADPEMFSIKGISLKFDENIDSTDFAQIMKLFAFQLIVGKKPKIEAPLWKYCAGGGIWAFSTATNQTFLQNGVPSREAFVPLATPIVIPPGVNFSASFVGGTRTLAGANGMRCTCLLSGLYAKGVQ